MPGSQGREEGDDHSAGEGEDELAVDIGAAFGALPQDVSAECFVIYIPDRDRRGKKLANQRRWVREGLDLLTEINGGNFCRIRQFDAGPARPGKKRRS